MAPLSDWAQSLRDSYPDPSDWKAFDRLPKRDVYRFTRLWMTEGIPYAFKDNPMVYDLGREALARALQDDPKQVSLTGSGRIGFSLAEPKFGKPFQLPTDLDLFIVSSTLFDRLEADSLRFIARVEARLAIPGSDRERMFWSNNVRELPSSIDRGFIDSWRVPVFEMYPAFRQVSRSLAAFLETVNNQLETAKRFSKVGLRTYKNWDRAVGQIGGSLCRTLVALNFRID